MRILCHKIQLAIKWDSTTNSSTWNGNAYSGTNISNLFIGDKVLLNSEYYYASVYCFVSKDFNGSCAYIAADGEVSGRISKTYDLNRKGFWQKLIICFKKQGEYF